MLGRIVVQKFRRALVLPDLHISIVRYRRHQTIIAYLVRVVRRRAPLLVNRKHGFRLRELMAGVAIRREAELIGDPLAKFTDSYDSDSVAGGFGNGSG